MRARARGRARPTTRASRVGTQRGATGIIGMLAVTQFIGQNILRKLRERDFGAIIDQKTGERRKMTPLEERYAMFLLGGRKGNTLRNHIRALVYVDGEHGSRT